MSCGKCSKCCKKKTTDSNRRISSKLLDVIELEKALEERGKNFWWLATFFIMAASPGAFNALHINAYVFISDNPKVWCDIEILQKANWTKEQIRNISVVNTNIVENCVMYDWDYTNFVKVGFKQAQDFIKNNEKPKQIPCKHYQYEQEKPTIVDEWDLVCDKTTMKTVAQAVVAGGKFVGAFLFGMFADKFGRKTCFVFSCILYIITGPIAAFVYDYNLFLIIRFLIGVAGSGVFECGFTIIAEMTVKGHRTRLGCLVNVSYPFGMVALAGFAYYSKNWRELQLYMSVPAILLLINCWYVPESPRWLLTQGRVEEAEIVVYGKKNIPSSTNLVINKSIAIDESERESQQPLHMRIFTAGGKLLQIFITCELLKRMLICYFGWFVASMSFYTIALNAHNFTANRYIYTALNGVAEGAGYFVPVVLLSFLGRKVSGVVLFLIAGFALLIIILLKNVTIIMIVALIGRFSISAVFAVIILHTSELFPTTNRNSAVGTSLTWGQVGAVVAPFIADTLGNIAWYIPSTLCGIVSIISGLLILFLPETRNKTMMDNIQDVKEIKNKEKVSFRNCCNFV